MSPEVREHGGSYGDSPTPQPPVPAPQLLCPPPVSGGREKDKLAGKTDLIPSQGLLSKDKSTSVLYNQTHTKKQAK